MSTAVLISKVLLTLAPGVTKEGAPILPKDTLGELGSILEKATDLGKIIFGPKDGTPNQPPSEQGKTLPEGLKDLLGGKKSS